MKRQRLFTIIVALRVGQWLRRWLVPASIAGLFLTAARLRPDGGGFGTHRQLGLPPCGMRIWFAIPCPACGMTTAWSHFVRGQWSASLAANPFGFGLALVATTALIRCVLVAVARVPHGRSIGQDVKKVWLSRFDLSLLSIAMVVIAAAYLDWIVRLCSR